MESRFWLPPLNVHDNYTTHVLVFQPYSPMIIQGSPQNTFLIRVHVDVTFYTESKQIPFKGLFVDEEFLLSFCSMICSSHEEVKKFISEILCCMHVPFELDHIRYSEWHLNRATEPNYRSSPEDADSWVVKLQEFLYALTQENHSVGYNCLPFNLWIKKDISISSDEFDTWLSWFQEKQRVDPNFRKAYFRAISRPRTIEELLEAENSHLKFGAEKSALLSVLQDASDFIHEESTTGQCMVCLEDLSAGCETSRLPCSHIFHKACIHKWLQESNMCPLCRSALPSD